MSDLGISWLELENQFRLAQVYGLCKVHEDIMIVCQHFAVNTTTYKLPKLLRPVLKPVTTNKYEANYLFTFSGEIGEQNSSFSMLVLILFLLASHLKRILMFDLCTF